MTPYWMTFKGDRAACVEGKDEAEARERAAMLGLEPLTVTRLPYPAEPRVGPRSGCPSFCYTPRACSGYSSCPKGYACSE